MKEDIRICHGDALDMAHSGIPTIITRVHTGRRGQPRIEVDPVFLEWAHNRRSISALA